MDVDDYVIDESSTVAAAILEQGNPVKSQDLESLSLQSAASETVASKTSPEDSPRKTSFQQLGSQKVNALVPATVATTPTAPTEPTRNRSDSVVRNSAVKVDGKYPLAKGQKTDAPMLNYIFDTFSSANKHHHHDQRLVFPQVIFEGDGFIFVSNKLLDMDPISRTSKGWARPPISQCRLAPAST